MSQLVQSASPFCVFQASEVEKQTCQRSTLNRNPLNCVYIECACQFSGVVVYVQPCLHFTFYVDVSKGAQCRQAMIGIKKYQDIFFTYNDMKLENKTCDVFQTAGICCTCLCTRLPGRIPLVSRMRLVILPQRKSRCSLFGHGLSWSHTGTTFEKYQCVRLQSETFACPKHNG